MLIIKIRRIVVVLLLGVISYIDFSSAKYFVSFIFGLGDRKFKVLYGFIRY